MPPLLYKEKEERQSGTEHRHMKEKDVSTQSRKVAASRGVLTATRDWPGKGRAFHHAPYGFDFRQDEVIVDF